MIIDALLNSNCPDFQLCFTCICFYRCHMIEKLASIHKHRFIGHCCHQLCSSCTFFITTAVILLSLASVNAACHTYTDIISCFIWSLGSLWLSHYLSNLPGQVVINTVQRACLNQLHAVCPWASSPGCKSSLWLYWKDSKLKRVRSIMKLVLF